MTGSACQLPTDEFQTSLFLEDLLPPLDPPPPLVLNNGTRARRDVYATFWRFAHERQEVFFRRVSGAPAPWSADPIIQRYKFTNAYRAADRVSQYLIQHVIYEGDQSVGEVFFRTLLFKIFNRISTWTLLKKELEEISWRDYHRSAIESVLTRALSRGQRIFSPAYIMSPAQQFGHSYKHRNYLSLLELMMREKTPERLRDATSLEAAYQILLSFPAIGEFLAYQFVTDLNYGPVMDFSEMDFVKPGPGAKDGIRKLFVDLGEWSEIDVIEFLADNQEREFETRGLAFRSLWGRPLHLIDVQNLLCEIGKYCRVKHPDVVGRSRRSRIKQRFNPQPAQLTYWFPPKWNINSAIGAPRDLTFQGNLRTQSNGSR